MAIYQGKWPPLATETEVNNCFGIYQDSEIIEHKSDDFNSFTAANDYNFGAQMTERLSRFLCRQINLLKAFV